MTDMVKSEGALIKTDEVGRVRMPVARRESLLAEFGRSGLSGPKFAALAGIKYQTFAGWVRKGRKRCEVGAPAAVKPVEAARWLEAVVAQAQEPTVMVLHLPGGVRVEVADEKQAVLAAVLVQALTKPC
jgi:hypothetical protein